MFKKLAAQIGWFVIVGCAAAATHWAVAVACVALGGLAPLAALPLLVSGALGSWLDAAVNGLAALFLGLVAGLLFVRLP